MGIVGQISDLVDGEQCWSEIAPEPVLQRASGFLTREIEDEVGRREKPRRVAGQNRLVDQILGDHGLAEAVWRDDDRVLTLREKVQGEDALDGGPMDRLRPRPFPVGHRLEAPETRISETPLDSLPQAGLELSLHQAFELHDRTPAFLGRARDEVIEIAGGVKEPELPQLITQRRRDRIG